MFEFNKAFDVIYYFHIIVFEGVNYRAKLIIMKHEYNKKYVEQGEYIQILYKLIRLFFNHLYLFLTFILRNTLI